MAGFDHQILTDVGWDAMANALAGQQLSFIHLEAGDGTVSGDLEMQGMTQLKHKVMDFPITSFSNDGKGQVTLIGTLASKNVTTGFYFRELGVKATIGGGAELLYSVCNAGATADYIPGSGEASIVTQSIQIVVKIDRATNVTVNIVAGDCTAQNIGLGTVGPGWFRDKLGSILNFKRFVQGTVVQLTETSDTIRIDNIGADTAANIGASTVGPGIFRDKINNILNLKRLVSQSLALTDTGDTITIERKILTANLDLWVQNGNPNIAPNFSTIQNALNYLMVYTIPSNLLATIHVLPGTFPNTTPVQNLHPNSNQIQIVGAAPLVKTVTNAGTFSGSAGNYSLVININDATGIAVNDLVSLRGTPCRVANGVWRVTAIAGLVLTLNVKTKQAGGFTQGAASCLGANLIAYPSKLTFTNSMGFLQDQSNPLFALIQNFSIYATDGPKPSIYGFHYTTSGKSTLIEVAVVNFNVGFSILGVGVGVNIDRLLASQNDSGMNIEAGGMFILIQNSSLVLNGNNSNGLQIITGGILRGIAGGTVEACGNGSIGVSQQIGGMLNLINVTNFRVWQNAGFCGMYLDTNAIVNMINASFIGNAGRDVLALRGAVLYGAQTCPIPAVITPANNTLSSDGAFLIFVP